MRLIDADLLKEDLSKFYDGIVTAMELIDSQPTVDMPKDQQPRVLTKAEIADFLDNIVWYETKYQDNSSDYFALVEDYTVKHEAVWLLLIVCEQSNRLSTADYGINWRVWSARPTDEQRKAVPWKDW